MSQQRFVDQLREMAGQVKLEDNSDARSIAQSQVGSEIKLQDTKREVKQEEVSRKSVNIAEKLTFHSSIIKSPLQIVVQSRSKQRRYPPRIHNTPFDPNTLWQRGSAPTFHRQQWEDIEQLLPLPASKHKLNPPQAYQPPELPFKRKQYRPPVPTNFKTGFDTFLSRRKNPGREKDLAVLDVDEVLEECKERKVLSQTLVWKHLAQNGTNHIKKFLEKWMMGRLDSFDFKRTEFTLLDHRRLSQLLLHLFPKEYTIGTPDALHYDFKQFFRKEYGMQSQDYVKSYMLLDSISGRSWWKQLKEKYKESQHYNYFRIKEEVKGADVLLRQFNTAQKRSWKLRELLGPMQLQNSETEIQKILSMKKGEENQEGEGEVEPTQSSYHQYDDEGYQRGSNTGQYFSSTSPRQHQFSSDIQAHNQRLVMGGQMLEEEEYPEGGRDEEGMYDSDEEEMEKYDRLD